MNREIKFRGRIVDTKEWVYGSLVAYPDGECNIITPRKNHTPKMDDWTVDVNTIGQFTGLRDINGREIYEGDYVKLNYKHDVASIGGAIPDQDCSCEGIVVYMGSSACFGIRIHKAEYPLDDNIGETFPLLIFDLDGDIKML